MSEGRLDLCIRFGTVDDTSGKRLGSARIQLFAAPGFVWKPGQPLPLVLLEPPCVFRSAAVQALDAAGIPWLVAVSCPGVSALWASVSAGLGVTARTPIAVPRGVRAWHLSQLPPLPRALLTLHGGETHGVALRALKRAVEAELRSQLSSRALRARRGPSTPSERHSGCLTTQSVEQKADPAPT